MAIGAWSRLVLLLVWYTVPQLLNVNKSRISITQLSVLPARLGTLPKYLTSSRSPDYSVALRFNHICNDESCKGNLPENPQALYRKQHSDIIILMKWTREVILPYIWLHWQIASYHFGVNLSESSIRCLFTSQNNWLSFQSVRHFILEVLPVSLCSQGTFIVVGEF